MLYGVLKDLGFSPELYLARVIYNQVIHPDLFTLLKVDGEWKIMNKVFHLHA